MISLGARFCSPSAPSFITEIITAIVLGNELKENLELLCDVMLVI